MIFKSITFLYLMIKYNISSNIYIIYSDIFLDIIKTNSYLFTKNILLTVKYSI